MFPAGVWSDGEVGMFLGDMFQHKFQKVELRRTQ